MEIHHAHHHDHPQHKEKVWKHYALEFFMLFLAVSAGFFAENLREEIKNKNQVQEDVRSLLSDLEVDSTLLSAVLAGNTYAVNMSDTLITLLAGDRSNTGEIYFLARNITANMGFFIFNDKTFQQMKSSGTLRLITPRSLLDSIGNYYSGTEWLTNRGSELATRRVDEVIKDNNELFAASVFQQMMHINYSTYEDSMVRVNRPEGNPPLLTNDPAKINQVATNYHYLYAAVGFYDKSGVLVQQKNHRLIAQIKKYYNMN